MKPWHFVWQNNLRNIVVSLGVYIDPLWRKGIHMHQTSDFEIWKSVQFN